MADELERALRQRDLELLAQSRNPRGVAPQKAGPLDLGVGLKERLAFLNQMFNPVEAIGQSMGAGERLLSGDVEGYDRLAALGDMLSGVAGVAAPALVAGRAAIPATRATVESLLGFSPEPRAADLGTPTDSFSDETFDENGFLTVGDMPVAQPTGVARLPSLLERVQRGEPLTEEEAFDVMTYERYGEDGVYDPTNTFENWLAATNDDTEAAARIAFLTDPTNPNGRAEPVAREPGPYFEDPFEPADEADFVDVETIDWDVDDDAWNPRLEMGSSFEVRPTIGQAEGIAGLYSPTRRAVDLLDRPSYDDLDSLRVQLLNRGAKPDELEGLMAKIPGTKNNPMSAEQVEAFLNDPKAGQFSKDDLARFADEASQDVVVSTRTLDNSPRDNIVFLDESYFLKGAEDIGANVFEAPVGPAVPNEASAHFTRSAAGRAPVLHTRFGMFRSPGADKPDTYHLGEVQSDWAQLRQKLPTDEAALQKLTEETLAIDTERQAIMDRYGQRRKEIKEALGREEREGEIYGGDDPELEEAFDNDPEHTALFSKLSDLIDRQASIEQRLSSARQYGTRGEFDAKFPAPYVGTTSKWVQLGLRQSLLDAVNRGAKRMTISTGEQVRDYTRGKESGQNKFYDEIVPKELNEVLRKFAKEAGIRKPEITMSQIEGSRGQRYTVPTVEFTDEFVEAIKRIGLPAYAKGGIVKGSYLDNDPLEPALY